jgi:hypothetical protein
MADRALQTNTNTWDSLHVIWKADKLESLEIGFFGFEEK